jgi:Bacterial membrane protein YfhO
VPFLGYMGVRYMLTRHHEELFPPWEPAWNGQGGKLWRNPEALPLFFVPASWRPARDPRDALLTTAANEDFSAAAVAEIPKAAGVEVRRVGSPLGETDITLRRQTGQVRLRAVHANGFELDVAGGGAAGGTEGALVVSSVTYCRGWRLAVDGRQADLLRVNAGFLGFLLPPGAHRATLEYRPAGWVWGLRLCGLTIVAILAALAWRAARPRRWW